MAAAESVGGGEPLKAKEYIDLLAEIGLTPYSAGDTVGVDRRTSYRFAAGDSPVSAAVAILLRLLVERKRGVAPKGPTVPCPLCSGRGSIPKDN